MKPIANPPNPFLSHDCEYLDGMTPPAKLEIFEDQTRSILSRNDSPDLGFRWSLNPYRGCGHGCTYCYARPSHEYLDFGSGTDFETKIVVKLEAAKLLREAFMKRSWKGELIVFSGDTDCYQPLEAHYQLTRQCLEVCAEFRNPVAIITKSALILRDRELLLDLHRKTHLSVTLSIPFIHEEMARVVEPFAASLAKRFETIEQLASQGIDVGVNIAPVIPGLNESDIPLILKKAGACGASSAAMILLRLPGSVKQVFQASLQQSFPLAYEKIMRRIQEVRGGRLNNAEFGKRFSGQGTYWETIEQLFDTSYRKYGFTHKKSFSRSEPSPFRRPSLQYDLL